MASINLELEWWKAGLALVGVVITASVPAWLGYRTAKRLNLTSVTLDEIKDRAVFRTILMKQVKEQGDRISELTKKVAELEEYKLKGNLREITLMAMVNNYELRIKVCEDRLAAHEILCTPKMIEGTEQ